MASLTNLGSSCCNHWRCAAAQLPSRTETYATGLMAVSIDRGSFAKFPSNTSPTMPLYALLFGVCIRVPDCWKLPSSCDHKLDLPPRVFQGSPRRVGNKGGFKRQGSMAVTAVQTPSVADPSWNTKHTGVNNHQCHFEADLWSDMLYMYSEYMTIISPVEACPAPFSLGSQDPDATKAC